MTFCFHRAIDEVPDDQFIGVPASYKGFCNAYDMHARWDSTGNKVIYQNGTTSVSFPSSPEGLTQIIVSHNSGGVIKDDTSKPSYWFGNLLLSKTPYKILKKLFQQCTPEDQEKILNPQEFDPKDDPHGAKSTTPALLHAFFRFKKEGSVDSIKLCRFITNSGANPFRKYPGYHQEAQHLQRPYLTEYLTDKELATIYEPAYKKQLVQARWLFQCLTDPQQDDPNGPAFEHGIEPDSALIIIQYCFGFKNTPKIARLFQGCIDQPLKAETEEPISQEIIS